MQVEKLSLTQTELERLDALRDTDDDALYSEVWFFERDSKEYVEFHVHFLTGDNANFDDLREQLGPAG